MAQYMVKRLITISGKKYLLEIPRSWVKERNMKERKVLVKINDEIIVYPFKKVRS
jgi:hypothetical protein